MSTDRLIAELHCCWVRSSYPIQCESNSMLDRVSLELEVEWIRGEWAGPSCGWGACWWNQQRSKKRGDHRSYLCVLGRGPRLGPGKVGSKCPVVPRAILRVCHDQLDVANHESSNRHQPVASPSWNVEVPANSWAFHLISRSLANCEGPRPSYW